MLTEPDRRELDTAPPHNRETKIAGIEMLRALAVLLVLFQHLPGMLPELALLWLPGRLLANFNGGAGVDIFFCISGFVVTRSLRRDMRGLTQRQTLALVVGFWIRRAFRLWPSAWLWLFVAYAVSLSFNRLGAMDPAADLQMVPAGIGMYSNFLAIHTLRHQHSLGVMSHYWSLSLEEQFYLALPLLLILSRRATLPILIFYAAFRFYDYQDFLIDVLLRPGSLVAGVLLAYLEGGAIWRRSHRMWRSLHASWSVCGGLILLAAVFESIGIFERWHGVAIFRFQAPCETLACFLIVLIAVQCSSGNDSTRLGRILMFLGGRSYAIYLVHPLAYAVARELDYRLFGNGSEFSTRLLTALVTATALIVFATELTVRFVEKPLQRKGRIIALRLSTLRWMKDRHSVSAPRSTSVRRIADIEALRTIAILFVMLQHAILNLLSQHTVLTRFFEWGQLWPGVDLFFVISGFLVTADLLRRLDECPEAIAYWRTTSRFWFRRAWRLWPTAWLWLVLIATGSAIVRPSFMGSLTTNVRSAAAGVLFFANVRFATCIIHFKPYGASYPYWSLSLEEQFYILLPLAIRFLGRHLPLAVFLAILVQLPLAHGTYYFVFRSDALLWGVALAVWARTPGYRLSEPKFLCRRLASGTFVLLSLVALFRWAGLGNSTPPFVVGGIAAIAALLVWAASYDRDFICPRFARPFVMWAGSRSYAFYVAHIPVFQCSAALANYLFSPTEYVFSGTSDAYAFAVMVPLLLISVEATHRFVERPLRALGTRMAERTVTATSGMTRSSGV